MKTTSNYDQLDSGLDVPISPMKNYDELNKLPFPCDCHEDVPPALPFTLSDLLWTALACLIAGVVVGVVWA